MRILHSIRSVNPEGGGPIEGIKQISKIHREFGRSVEVVSLDSPDAAWARDFPLPLNALGPVKTKYGYNTKLLPWLRAHVHAYDSVIINGLWQYNSFAVWRALHKSPTPYFVFPHG